MAYPDKINDPELFKIKTEDDEIKDKKCKTEKHDHESLLDSLKVDSDFYWKK